MYDTDATRTETIELHVQASSNTKIRSHSAEPTIPCPAQDGLVSLFDKKAVSEAFDEYFNEVFDWIENPDDPVPMTIAPLTRSENIPIKVLDFKKINVVKSQMFIHPLHEIFQTIIRTTPLPKPRGRLCSQSSQDRPEGHLKLLPPEPRDYDVLLDFYRQAFSLPCISLPQGRYLYIGSPNLLSEMNRRRNDKLRFSIMESPKHTTTVETVEAAVTHSFRLAFACLREEPYYLKQDIRCRLLSIFRALGLLPAIFGATPIHTICRILQIPPSTARAKSPERPETQSNS